LHDEGGARLAIVALESNHDDIPSFHGVQSSLPWLVSIQFMTSFSRRFFAAAALL
jgi:hypothetical protein